MGEKPHERLEAWRKSLDMVVKVYEATSGFPPEERFGLVAQIRRAAVSVPSNIAEGAARGPNRFFTSALQIAPASLSELDSQIAISIGLGYLNGAISARLIERIDEVERILNGLVRATRRKVTAAVVGSACLIAFLAF